MGDHPRYLECHIRCQHYLMHGDGLLPFQWRAMIAVLVSLLCVFAKSRSARLIITFHSILWKEVGKCGRRWFGYFDCIYTLFLGTSS